MFEEYFLYSVKSPCDLGVSVSINARKEVLRKYMFSATFIEK